MLGARGKYRLESVQLLGSATKLPGLVQLRMRNLLVARKLRLPKRCRRVESLPYK